MEFFFKLITLPVPDLVILLRGFTKFFLELKILVYNKSFKGFYYVCLIVNHGKFSNKIIWKFVNRVGFKPAGALSNPWFLSSIYRGPGGCHTLHLENRARFVFSAISICLFSLLSLLFEKQTQSNLQKQ
jgi:hypothetical protein